MIYPLLLDDTALAAYGRQIGDADPDSAVLVLADALAHSPGWERFPGCSILVRRNPAALAIYGDLTADQLIELSAQADALKSRCSQFRFVTYQQAEEDAARLAARLRPLLAGPEWQNAHFVAIPRGGHLVLALLATLLECPRERLLPARTPDVPLVVVDDCALSGIRFRQFLNELESPRILFAHLYSQPALREAILASEPRVAACVAAADLSEPAFGDVKDRGWWQQLPGPAYLRRPAEFVAFAWSEPDRVVGHPMTGELLAGWKLLPPALCLKHRSHPGIPVHMQPQGGGTLCVAADVWFVSEGEAVLIAARSTGKALRLEGLAAAAWRELAEHGAFSQAEARLSRRFEVTPEQLDHDLRSLIHQFQSLGLLEGDLTMQQRSD